MTINLNQIAKDLSLSKENTSLFVQEAESVKGFNIIQLQQELEGLHTSQMYTDASHPQHAAAMAISVILQSNINDAPLAELPVIVKPTTEELAAEHREKVIKQIAAFDADDKPELAQSLRDSLIKSEQAAVSKQQQYEDTLQSGINTLKETDELIATDTQAFLLDRYNAAYNEAIQAGLRGEMAVEHASKISGHTPPKEEAAA